MVKANPEYNRWTIPSDWDEETDGFLCYVMCVPNSRQWRGVFDGHIDTLAYGRKWNKLSGQITDVQAIAREVFESMCAVRCDEIFEVLSCICEQLTEQTGQGTTEGQTIEDPPSDGTITVGPGEQFPDQQAYFDAKCSVANAIFDTVLAMVDWLAENEDGLIVGQFGGVTSGLLVGIGIVGIASWVWGKVKTFVSSLAGQIVATATGFAELSAAMNDTHQETVLAMFNASNAHSAETNAIAAIQAGTPTIGTPETLMLKILLSSDMLNNLFDPREDIATYVSPSPIDCGAAILQLWTFPTDVQGWTFSDDSDPGSSASREYDAVLESIGLELVVASLPFETSSANNISPTVAIPVTPGASVQVDFAGTSDAPKQQRVAVTAIYTDATSEENDIVGSDPGTLLLDITQSKTIETVEVLFQRSTSETAQGSTHTTDLLEVRIVGL